MALCTLKDRIISEAFGNGHYYQGGIRQTAAGERGGGMTNGVDTGAPCRLETAYSGSWFGAYRGTNPVQNVENISRTKIVPSLSLSLSLSEAGLK